MNARRGGGKTYECSCTPSVSPQARSLPISETPVSGTAMSREECEKDELSNRGALREVPLMGVIYVVHEASKLGFYNGNPEVSERIELSVD